eukprot:Hpha_TRINITY_DN15862_c1_g10::TRINITY_DN15862_c1_g10_i1::g.191801::m.191801
MLTDEQRQLDGTVGFAGATQTGRGKKAGVVADAQTQMRRMDQDERLQLREMLDVATAELNRVDCDYEFVEGLLTKALQWDDSLPQVWLLRALARFELGSSLFNQVDDKQELKDAGHAFSDEESKKLESIRAWGERSIQQSLEDANRCLDMQPGNVFAFMRKAVALFYKGDYILTEQVLQEALEKHAFDDNLQALMMITKFRLARWKADSMNSHPGAGDPVKQDLKAWRAYMEDCVRYSRLAMQNAKDYRTAQQGMSCLFRSLLELSYSNIRNPLDDAVKVVRAIRVHVLQLPFMSRVETITFIFRNKTHVTIGNEDGPGVPYMVYLENDEYITALEGQRDAGFVEGIRFEIASPDGKGRETQVFGASLDSFEGSHFKCVASPGQHITGIHWDALRDAEMVEDAVIEGEEVLEFVEMESLVQPTDFKLQRSDYPGDQLFALALGDEEHTIEYLDDKRELPHGATLAAERDDPRCRSLDEQQAQGVETEIRHGLPVERVVESFRNTMDVRKVIKVKTSELQGWLEASQTGDKDGQVYLVDMKDPVQIGRIPHSCKAAVASAGLSRGQRILKMNGTSVKSPGDLHRVMQQKPSEMELVVQTPLPKVTTASLFAILGRIKEPLEDLEDPQVVPAEVRAIEKFDEQDRVPGLRNGMHIKKLMHTGAPEQHALRIETDQDLEDFLSVFPDAEEHRTYTMFVEHVLMVPTAVLEELISCGAVITSSAKLKIAGFRQITHPPMRFEKRRTIAESLGCSVAGFSITCVVGGGAADGKLRKSMRIAMLNNEKIDSQEALEEAFEDAEDDFTITVTEPPTFQAERQRSSELLVLRRGLEISKVGGKSVRSLGDLEDALKTASGLEYIQVVLKDPDWDPIRTFFDVPEVTLDGNDPRTRVARLPDVHSLVPGLAETLKELTEEEPDEMELLSPDDAANLGPSFASPLHAHHHHTTSPVSPSFNKPDRRTSEDAGGRRTSTAIGEYDAGVHKTGLADAADYLCKHAGDEVVDLALKREMKEEVQYHLVAKNVRDMLAFGDHAMAFAQLQTDRTERQQGSEEASFWFQNAAHSARLQTAVAKMRDPTSHMRLDGMAANAYCKNASARMVMDDTVKAEVLIEDAKNFTNPLDSRVVHARASLAYQQQDFVNAIQLHQKHQEIQGELGNPDLQAAAYTNLAFAQCSEQEYTSAFANFRAAKELWKGLDYWSGVVFILNTLAQFCIQFNSTENVQEGFEYLREAVHHHPDLFDSTIFRYPSDPLMFRRYLRMVQTTYRTTAELLFRANLRRDSLLWAEYGKSRTVLDKLATKIHRMGEPGKIKYSDVALYAKKNKCTVLVYYYMMYQGCYEGTVCIWKVTSSSHDSGRIMSFVCDMSAVAWNPIQFVESAAREVRKGAIGNNHGGNDVDSQATDDGLASGSEDTLARLYDTLVAPVMPQGKPEDDTIVICPHGKLQTVPWAALLAPDFNAQQEESAGKTAAPLPGFADDAFGGESVRRHLVELFTIHISHGIEQLLYMDEVRGSRQESTAAGTTPAEHETRGPVGLYDVTLPLVQDEMRSFGGKSTPCNNMTGKEMKAAMANAVEVHLRVRRLETEILTPTEAAWDPYTGEGILGCRQVLRRSVVPYAERVVSVSDSLQKKGRWPPTPMPNRPIGRLYSAQPLYVQCGPEGEPMSLYGEPGEYLSALRRSGGDGIQVKITVPGLERVLSLDTQARELEDTLTSKSFADSVMTYLETGRIVVAVSVEASSAMEHTMALNALGQGPVSSQRRGEILLNPSLRVGERSPLELSGVIANPKHALPVEEVAETMDLGLCRVILVHSSGSIKDCIDYEPKPEFAGVRTAGCFRLARQFMAADGGWSGAGASYVALNTWPTPVLDQPSRRYTSEGVAVTYAQWVNMFGSPKGWTSARRLPQTEDPPEIARAAAVLEQRNSGITAKFWENVRQGSHPSSALREAQLAVINEAREAGEAAHWLSWASWQVIM